jgi:hypothetical protein
MPATLANDQEMLFWKESFANGAQIATGICSYKNQIVFDEMSEAVAPSEDFFRFCSLYADACLEEFRLRVVNNSPSAN